MQPVFSRTERLLGSEAMERLHSCRVAVFGIGGVGGYVVEALARTGVGALDLIDHDTVCPSNLNRQIIATRSTIGMDKVDAAASRIRDINPDCRIKTWKIFYLPETADQFDFRLYDYVVDAIDTVAGKIALIEASKAADTPIISAMGAGNKMDPTAFRIADIYETSVCPLARVMRSACRKRGITDLKVVYSTEAPLKPLPMEAEFRIDTESPEASGSARRDPPGSIAFVTAAAGLILAGAVVRDLIAPIRS